MNESLPSIAIRRPVTVLMVVITVLGLGVITWYRIPLEFLPEMDFPFIFCYVPYPGATPEQVENEVAIPAEGEFRTVSQLKRISTHSNSDGCSIQMLFDWNADMGIAASEVRDRMERLKLSLPSSVDRLYLRRFSSESFPVMLFSLTSAGDHEDLAHLARTIIRSHLLRVDGIANVEVYVGPEPEVLIQFDQSRLRSRNLSLYQVVTTLQNSSLNVSVGELADGQTEHYVRLLGEFRGPEDIAELVIGPNSVRVKDVAEVGYRTRDITSDHALDGKRGVVVVLQKESEANTVDACRAVTAELEDLLKQPQFEDLEMFMIFDQSEVITSALDALLAAGKYGGLLALVVLFLFLRRVRPTLLVAAAIPSSLVVAFVCMFFTSMTLNLVTMISMIVGLGMLVDNSIVVIENILRYNQLGLPARESARRGASEVSMAITAATLTTLVVFIPILYLESGEMATYMKQFGLPITVSLVASLVIALTVIPLASCFMKELRPDASHPIRSRLSSMARRIVGEDVWSSVLAFLEWFHPLTWLINAYAWCLGWAMRWRLATACLVFAVVAVTAAIPMRNVGRIPMPEPDQREVDIQLTFDRNFDLEMARGIIEQVQAPIDELREELGIRNIFTQIRTRGGSIGVYLLQKDDLESGETFPYTTEEVRDILWQSLPSRVPGAEVKFEIAQADEGDKGVALRLRGEDSKTLSRYAESLKEALMARVPKLTEVVTEEDDSSDEIQLRIDEMMAGEAGVAPIAIAQTVDFALRGHRLPYLKQGGREIPVWAQFREEDRKTRANLDNVAVLTDSGELVPLNRLVSLTRGRSPRGIARVNGKNVTTVTAKTRAKDLDRVIRDIKTVLATFDMPRGYSAEMGDKAIELETDMTNFITAMLLSCILIYLVMGALFESYLLPFSILWSVPMALLGVYWMLFITDTPIDTVALIGIILMTGIVVNNGIVIVDHINQLRKGGAERYDAIVQAGRDRFRPVMMTALTTILGCVPIAIGGEIGSEVVFKSLGRALIGGLSSGTVLTLIVVPLVYTLVDDLRMWILRFFADLGSLRPARSR